MAHVIERWSGLFRAAFGALALLTSAAALAAVPPGSYRCWSYNVSGGGGSCRLAPPIVIHADGSYDESSTHGVYRVSGDRIAFSESKIRGPGLIAGNRIEFEYDYRGWHHTVTYLCEDCGAGASNSSSARGSHAGASAPIWLQLRLDFDRPDGYFGWVSSAHLVPAEQAARFAASPTASPPAGSSTGSAYALGGQQIVANFRQATGGARYVVFLDSGRERIPVATVDVPSAPSQQTIALNASLSMGSGTSPVRDRPMPEEPRVSTRFVPPTSDANPAATQGKPCVANVPHYSQPGCVE